MVRYFIVKIFHPEKLIGNPNFKIRKKILLKNYYLRVVEEEKFDTVWLAVRIFPPSLRSLKVGLVLSHIRM